MSELLIYQAKVAIVIVVFYLFYRVIARKETYHHLNRIVLILSTLLSFILPVCVITITQIIIIEEAQPNQNLYINQIAEQKIDWILALGVLYIIGASTVASYIIISYIKFKKLMRGCKLVEHSATARIYTTSQNITPCSWLNNIIISESDLNIDTEIIIAHEKVHVKLKHSLDIAFIDLCCIIQWFNPAIWLVRITLKEIHEYQADSSVISQGFNAKNYQLLLIKKVVGSESYSIANNLNHSSLKNRITMMLSRKSSVSSRLKLLYVVPLIGISLTTFAQIKTTTIDQSDKGNKNSITTKSTTTADVTYYKSEMVEHGKKFSAELTYSKNEKIGHGERSPEETDTIKRSTISQKSDIRKENSSIDKSHELTIYINSSKATDNKRFYNSIEKSISNSVAENGTDIKVSIVSSKTTDLTEIKNILRKLGIQKVSYTTTE